MTGEDLLLKYISDGLSKDERFELEKIALTDDFLAQAWQGLSSSSANHREIYLRIREKLKNDQEARVIPMYKKLWPYAVAASLVAILAFSVLLRQPQNQILDAETGLQIENSDAVALNLPDFDDNQTTAENEQSEETPEVIIEEDPNFSSFELRPEKKSEVIREEKSSRFMDDEQKLQSNSNVAALSLEEKKAMGQDKLASVATQNNSGILSSGNENEVSAPIPDHYKTVISQNAEARSIKAKKVKSLSNDTGKNDMEIAAFTNAKSLDAQERKAKFQNNIIANDTLPNSDIELEINREALENEKEPIAQSKYHFRIASILFRKMNKYSEAKQELLRAAQLNPAWGRPYVLLGDIYSETATNCGDSWNQSLAILAAHDMWLTAKSKELEANIKSDIDKKLERYKEYLPEAEDGFMRGIKSGDKVTVGCWIDEWVIVRFK